MALSRLDAKAIGARSVLRSLNVEHLVEQINIETERATSARAIAAAQRYAADAELLGEKQAWKLRQIVATESAQAFNRGVIEQARNVEVTLGVEIWRTWDAQLDACDICAGLDGTKIRVTNSFPDGEPGSVHPSCRCTDVISTS